MAEREEKQAVRNLGWPVLGWIAAAVIVAAIVVGLWLLLRGNKDKRAPETPQNTSELCLPEPGYKILATRS